MVGASSAGRRLRAVIALVVVAGLGSAHAARTPDWSDAGSGVVSIPIERRSQTSSVDGVVRTVQLPRGASAISETYGDWIVKCLLDGGTKLCTLGQTQSSKETNQQVFAIELIPRDGKAEGNMLMPFGLKLDAGAVVKLDGKDLAVDALVPALKAAEKPDTKSTIIVNSDKGVEVSRLVEVMDTLRLGGFTSVSIATRKS